MGHRGLRQLVSEVLHRCLGGGGIAGSETNLPSPLLVGCSRLEADKQRNMRRLRLAAVAQGQAELGDLRTSLRNESGNDITVAVQRM